MHTLSQASSAVDIERVRENQFRRNSKCASAAALSVAFCAMAHLASVQATTLPEGAHLVKGAVSIVQRGGDHPVMTIQQQELIALVEWQTFDIGENASVHVVSDDPNALLINRVVGPAASTIDGALTANSAVWLINPHGYHVGARADVSTRQFLATSQDIDPEALLRAADALRVYAPANTRQAGFIHSGNAAGVNLAHARPGRSARSLQVDQDDQDDSTQRERSADGASEFSGSDAEETRNSAAPNGGSEAILPVPYPLVIPVTPSEWPPEQSSLLPFDGRRFPPLNVPLNVPPSPPSLASPETLPLSATSVGNANESGSPDGHHSGYQRASAADASQRPILDVEALVLDVEALARGVEPLAVSAPHSPPIRPRRLGLRTEIHLPDEPFAFPPSAWADLQVAPVSAEHSVLHNEHDAAVYLNPTPVTTPAFLLPEQISLHFDHRDPISYSDTSSDSSSHSRSGSGSR